VARSGRPRVVSEIRSIAGIRTFVRRREGPGTPTVFVHGNPTDSADWLAFIETLDAPSVAFDLPCFGRSERVPRWRFAADLWSYGRFVEAAIDALAIERFNLVVHDWGGIGLLAAQARPDAVERLVIINAVPLDGAYRWHWLARIWRRRIAGELFTATTSKPAMRLLLRQARPGLAAMPPEFVARTWESWDRGMAAAMLRLYRSADPGELAAAGADLERVRCPALVVWGQDDPYLGPEWGRRYAERLPGAELLELDHAGHWPWIDRPELIERVTGFLEAG
jgi:pimeloyl-ACP methyl ester carboxylesterase